MHREEVAQSTHSAAAAEQGFHGNSAAAQDYPGNRPSWCRGVQLSEEQNKECFILTMKYIFDKKLSKEQRCMATLPTTWQ